MPDEPSEWVRKYSIDLDPDQRKLISLYGNVRYFDGKETYHNNIISLKARRSGDLLAVSGTWFDTKWEKYENLEFAVPPDEVIFSRAGRRHDKPGTMRIYTEAATMTAQELAWRIGWSVSKVRRVARRTYGPLSIHQETFFVEKRKYKGSTKKYEFFVGTNRSMRAVALGKPYEGEVAGEDVRVLSYVRSATDELLEKYGRDQPWRPTFHPKEPKRDLKMPAKHIRESMSRMTGLLCYVIDVPHFSTCQRSRVSSMWMLPEVRDRLADEILREAGEAGLVVYGP